MSDNKCENILYELLVYSEWIQEPDLKYPIKSYDGNQVSLLFNSSSYLKKSPTLNDEIWRFLNWQLPWKFAAGEQGKVVAILQDNLLEIRTSRDEYSSVVGKGIVGKDPFPQWRRLAWSPDCSMLAVASSNGSVHFYDLLGSNLFNIPSPNESSESDNFSNKNALASILFIPSRTKNPKWSTELLVVDYSGFLRSYFVSPVDHFMEHHTFLLSKVGGLSSVTWHPSHNVIFVSSVPKTLNSGYMDTGYYWGLTAWRLLNDYPYYKLAVPDSEEKEKMELQRGLWSYICNFKSAPPMSVVFHMQVSPSGSYLACLHTCGMISLWVIPGLRRYKMFKLEEQHDSMAVNPAKMKNSKESNLEDGYPIDLSWWSENRLIIARKSGAVSVYETGTFQNLLGDNPEFLCGEPALSTICTDRGFLALECDVHTISNKRKLQSTDGDNENNHLVNYQSDLDSSDEEETLLSYGTELIKTTIYFVTDIEQFRPIRKRPKVIQRTYRLLGLKSTTPEELFTRKIDNEEYNEALFLAKTYGLDSDRVYQRQWRNSPVSISTIHDLLSKISKYSWVLQECCERVPETLVAAKELIQFGLNMTENELKSLLSDDDNLENADSNKFKEIDLKKKLESLAIENITDDLRVLIMARLKLLKYSDRLLTYQMILGCNNGVLDEHFDSEFYNKFRYQDTVNSAIEFAHQGNVKAVEFLLTYHGHETIKYWLTILENFPETMLPSSYSYLLPECNGDSEVSKWECNMIRDEDWCELNKFKHLLHENDDTQLVIDNMTISKCYDNLTSDILTEWYLSRIYQMEKFSHLVDPPLDLIRLAKQRFIKGLDDLHHQLLTLDVLIYELKMEDLDLTTLEKKNALEKALLLLSDSTEGSFVEDILHRIMPYIDRCEKLSLSSHNTILLQILKHFSKNSLSLPFKVFQYINENPINPIVNNLEDRVLLTIDCLYEYTEVDDLDKAFKILAFLPDPSQPFYNKDIKIKTDLENLRAELEAAVILKKYGQPKSLLYIHKISTDLEESQKLVLRIARSIAHKVPSASEIEWNELLADVLKLQKLVFNCMSLELCHELYASTVLASGNAKIIRSAMKILSCCKDDENRKSLSFERSIFLVLQAAREYFDSASNLTDPGIQHSKTCLNLIIEEKDEITQELDLIDSLQIIHEFGVKLLPIQVRLSMDKMRLIVTCVNSSRSAYRNLHKLLTLSDKLRICGKEKHLRRGSVLVKIAETAFDVKDYVFCSGICKTIIEEEHTIGWEVCKNLGQCSEHRDISARHRCVLFAILHCPADCLQSLSETSFDLRREALQFEISKKLSMLDSNSVSFEQDDEFVDALTSPSTPSKEFLPFELSSKFQTTTKFLSKITATDFWKNSLNLSIRSDNKNKLQIQLDNSDFKKQAFLDFYASLHPGCHFTVPDSSNMNKKKLEQYKLVYMLLKAALMEEEMGRFNESINKTSNPLNNVLIQCSKLIMSEDCYRGLGFLFGLTDETLAEQCFTALPQSQFCLQLALFFYSMVELMPNHDKVFSLTPSEVISQAFKGPPRSERIYKLIKKYRAKLDNYMQAEKMKELNCGVNIDRFSEDAQYKQDSILGLAMSPEWEKVELALELGQIHGVSGCDVAINHIVSLLLSGNHQPVMEHLADNKLSSLLLEQPHLVEQRLVNSVFPNINGLDHQLMISYYSVLQCVSGNTTFNELTPKEHIKLIKKVKSTSSAIDYKGLLQEPLLKVLRPALNKESVANIARLLKTLPQHLRGSTTISMLYLDLLNTGFFYQCLGFTPENDSLNQFMSLKVFFSKLTTEDLVQFVKTCIFSRNCAQQLSPDIRTKMLLEVILFCEENKNSLPHEIASSTLKQWLEHINNIWRLMETEKSTNENIKTFLIELDVSCGDLDAITNVIEGGLFDKLIPFSLIEGKTPNSLFLPNIISKAIKANPLVPTLDVLLERIEICVEKNLKDPDWSSLLQEYTTHPELSSQSRLLIAALLQKLNKEPATNIQLVTEAVLGRRINNNEIINEEARSKLFFNLLEESSTWANLCTLKHLLSCWPAFSFAEPQFNPPLNLIIKLVIIEPSELLSVIKEIITQHKICEQGIVWLVDELECSDKNIPYIWINLLSSNSELHQNALQRLENIEIELIPEEIIRRFIELSYISTIIESCIYNEFIESLIILNDDELINSTVRQLMNSEHLSEAGHLIMMYSGVPSPLRTFSAALNVIGNFLSK